MRLFFLGARTGSGHRPFEFVIVSAAAFAVASQPKESSASRS